jgi:hypothetical protein
MRPRERRDSGQNDLFKARLDQIVNTDHALAKLGRAIDWRFLEKRFGAVYSDKAGHPPLPTRLRAGLSILKHMHNLSDEDLCARWVDNPYYQLFCGEEFFQHKLSPAFFQRGKWRARLDLPMQGPTETQTGRNPRGIARRILLEARQPKTSHNACVRRITPPPEWDANMADQLARHRCFPHASRHHQSTSGKRDVAPKGPR